MGSRLSVDGSTLALWQANGSGDLIDATGNYVLTKNGVISSVPGLISHAIHIDAPTKFYTHALDATFRNVPLADFTMEFLVKAIPNAGIVPTGGACVFTFEDPVANSWGMQVQIYGDNAIYLSGGPNTGGGGYATVTHCTLPPISELWIPKSLWNYVAIVVKPNYPTPGNSRSFFFINGQSAGASNVVTPFGISAFATAQLMIGNFWGSPNTPVASDQFHIYIEEIRISTIERSDLDIRQTWSNYSSPIFAGGSPLHAGTFNPGFN